MYHLLRAFSWVISRFSPKTLSRISRFLTWIIYDVLRGRRKLVEKNIQLAFGDEISKEERSRIGRESVYNFLMTTFEFFHSSHNDIAADIRFEGEENIRQALDQGQGVYILCMHIGNWEAMGSKITRGVCPSHVLVKKVGSDGVDRFVSELRDRNGFGTVKRRRKGDGFRGIKEVLARGEIVGFVMDQARPGEPRLPFFGHPAKTNTSLAAIWRRVRAPIVPSYIVRTAPGQHVVKFFPELQLQVTDNDEQDILDHSLFFNGIVEKCVREVPEQYLWMHNRWK